MREEAKREIDTLKKALAFSKKRDKPFSALTDWSHSGNEELKEEGKSVLSQGQCGAIILAGGMASRLRTLHPKGTFPITEEGKTLYQLLSEKICRRSEEAGRPLEVALMTSNATHDKTVRYFEDHGYFRLKKEQLHFFCQEDLPFLDFELNPLIDEKGSWLSGPRGNGNLYKSFMKSGLFERWKASGIETLSITPIDNPLADPFDPEAFAFQQKEKADIVIKGAIDEKKREKMGLCLLDEGKISIVEYGELFPIEERVEPRIANLGLFFFSLDFMKQASTLTLPLHPVKKAVTVKGSFDSAVNVWKFEEFIFDAFESAKKISLLLYPMDKIFAPLKSMEDLPFIRMRLKTVAG